MNAEDNQPSNNLEIYQSEIIKNIIIIIRKTIKIAVNLNFYNF